VLSVQEFMNLLELKGNANYKELQKVTLGLMKKVLVIKRPEEKTLTQVNWINYAHYEEGNGNIQLAFSDVMKPFLCAPSMV
jgi:plasmid replication initiation protein